MTVDVKKLFNEELPAALARRPDDARKIGGKYQLNIADAGSWGIDLVSNPPSVKEGPLSDPQCTLDLAEPDFQTVVADPAAGLKLFFAGKLKVKGNQMLAMNLQKLLSFR